MSMSTSPLREPQERMWFCDAYFRAVGAACKYEADGYREYELPRDVDKELTDRPYYWMWVEQTGQDVPPTVLRCAFTEEAQARENERLRHEALQKLEASHPSEIERMFFRPPTAELVSLGSFRLDKIFLSLHRRGRFACVRDARSPESVHIPWLLVNALISYRCDVLEQEWFSVGVCLVTGQTMGRFMRLLDSIPMEPATPAAILGHARIRPEAGLQTAREVIQDHAFSRPGDWAQDARDRLSEELRQIQLYYDSLMRDAPAEEQPLLRAERQRKMDEAASAMTPRIEVEAVQVALVGLAAPGHGHQAAFSQSGSRIPT
jgi:hypothetical protein